MRIYRLVLPALLVISALAASTAAFGGVVVWVNAQSGSLYFKDYPSVTTPQQVIDKLIAGPGEAEAALGLTTAIPAGTKLRWVQFTPNGAVISLSQEAAAGIGETSYELMQNQFMYTLTQFGLDADVHVLIDDLPATSYMPPLPQPIYSAPLGPPPAAPNTVGLSGKRITLSAGHGYYYTGSYWTTQRSAYCGGTPEDFHNLKMSEYLKTYLETDGAYVQPVREFNLSRGNGPSGHPWWQECAQVYLMDAGYSCSVTSSSSGVCSYTGTDHGNDDVRARPLASNLDSRGNTDIYVAVHTNGFQGTCNGSACPSGTDVMYTNTGGHEAWGPASITLGQDIHDEVISAIQSSGEKRADGVTWGCHGSCSTKYKDLGECRIPSRPAALLELGFHDSCTSDSPKLEETFFQSVAMWGMYKGICDYFGVSPTWGMYSGQYVSDDIPDTMNRNETYTCHITLRNRGVLWSEARQFRLGAVGDSDPFTTATRCTITGEVDPSATYTFTLTLKAPNTVGAYTTDWRMLREGVSWFGPTVSKTVSVVDPTPDDEPPTKPTNLTATLVGQSQINLAWTASTDNQGVMGYKIYRNGSFRTTTTATSYSDTGLSSGDTFTYQVSAYDSHDNESELSDPASATTPVVTNIIIDNTSASFIGSWSTGTGRDHQVWRRLPLWPLFAEHRPHREVDPGRGRARHVSGLCLVRERHQ